MRHSPRSRIARAGSRALLTALVLLAAAAAPTGTASSARAAQPPRPNIVLILADDLRWDSLWPMSMTWEGLAKGGATFANAFVTNPLCCPSRASILTGTWSHTNGVWFNRPPHGGFVTFDDHSTVATWLHDAGYRTGLIGKYLNGYTAKNAGTYVPPGWDRWWGVQTFGYTDYTVVDDGVFRTYQGPGSYITDQMSEEAVRFIRSSDGPFFLEVAARAPHGPATPAPRHADAFTGFPPWRPASWNESNVADKPEYVRDRRRLSPARAAEIDALRLDQYRTLLSLDESVQAMLDVLQRTDRLQDTMLIFTSDNGYLWGEHRLWGKVVPYEESIRVPLLIRYDREIAPGTEIGKMALNVDLAPTIADAAGIASPGAEGRSLMPLLRGASVDWRDDFLVEHYGANAPSYCGVRSRDQMYVRYATGEEELYNLRRDPFELHNRASWATASDTLAAARVRVSELCTQPPPGMPPP